MKTKLTTPWSKDSRVFLLTNFSWLLLHCRHCFHTSYKPDSTSPGTHPACSTQRGLLISQTFFRGLCLCSPSSFRSVFLDQGWVRDSLMARGTDHTSAIAGLPCSLNCTKCPYFPLYLVPGTQQALKKNC